MRRARRGGIDAAIVGEVTDAVDRHRPRDARRGAAFEHPGLDPFWGAFGRWAEEAAGIARRPGRPRRGQRSRRRVAARARGTPPRGSRSGRGRASDPPIFRYRGEYPSRRKPSRSASAIDAPLSGCMFASTRCSSIGPNAYLNREPEPLRSCSPYRERRERRVAEVRAAAVDRARSGRSSRRPPPRRPRCGTRGSGPCSVRRPRRTISLLGGLGVSARLRPAAVQPSARACTRSRYSSSSAARRPRRSDPCARVTVRPVTSP